MKLLAAISIFAGGPGSGCNPKVGKCGRPRIHDEGASAKLNQGDRVALTKPLKVFNEKAAWFRTAPVGTTATVRAIKPAFGHNPEMVRISITGHSPEWVPRDQVFLTKAAVTKVQVAPVPEKQVLRRYDLEDGGKLTVIQPSANAVKPPKNLSRTAHPGRENFKDITQRLYQMGFRGDPKSAIKMFDMKALQPADAKSKVYYWRKGRDRLEGATVFVHNFASGPKKGVLIREFNTGQYGQATYPSRYKMGQKYQLSGVHEFRYKRFGQAAYTMRKRYGISLRHEDFE